ncbi:hypothetical protein XELAEV_18020325mg [Xenopus laevis]|uniref:Uncharacterized protein n=1 Tax=Xenopus laevis TaxID=8355 RepID=A0A974HQY1_XENLA|nr:hypothetical protein XELAEV_18020325mg [Xenopus laevis]
MPKSAKSKKKLTQGSIKGFCMHEAQVRNATMEAAQPDMASQLTGLSPHSPGSLISESDSIPPQSPMPLSDANLLARFKTLLQMELATVTTTITKQLTREIRDLGTRTDQVEQKLDEVIRRVNDHDIQIDTLLSHHQSTMDRLEDFENRSRIRGLPEMVKDLHVAIPKLLATLVPDIPEQRLEMDRVHRALGPMKPGGPPRDIIARLHFYASKEAIMMVARTTSPLKYGDHAYQIFADLASTTIQKRRLLKQITMALHQKKIAYRWGYPFRLLFSYQNQPHSIRDLDTGKETLRKLRLLPAQSSADPTSPLRPPAPSPQTATSPRLPITPNWQSTQRTRRPEAADDRSLSPKPPSPASDW